MNILKLYHGSNVEVRIPQIIQSVRNFDFGKGFYLTTDYEQAKKQSILTTERRENGRPTISVFEISEEDKQNLLIHKYEKANKEWLEFVSKNRSGQILECDWDIIVGPVANDNTMPVVTLYLRGDYDADEALKRLLTQKLKDQVVFKTEKSLAYLKFVEVIEV